jgi:hypothetical protein
VDGGPDAAPATLASMRTFVAQNRVGGRAAVALFTRYYVAAREADRKAPLEDYVPLEYDAHGILRIGAAKRAWTPGRLR